MLERRIGPFVEPRIKEQQCGFRTGRGTALYPRKTDGGVLGDAQTSVHVLCRFGEGSQPGPSGLFVGVLQEYGVQDPCFLMADFYGWVVYSLLSMFRFCMFSTYKKGLSHNTKAEPCIVFPTSDLLLW